MVTDTAAPTTEAGKRLLHSEIYPAGRFQYSAMRDHIRAIEAEAVANERQRIAEAVQAEPEPTLGLKGGVNRAAVLRIVAGE